MDSIPQKQCSRCGEWKPATNEYFHIRNASPDKLAYVCIWCKNKHGKPERIQGFRRCNVCKELFPETLDYFYFNSRWQCFGAQCKRCYSIKWGHIPKEILPDGYKRCCTCDEVLPLDVDHFNHNKANHNGFTSECKTCQNVRSKQYHRRKHPFVLRVYKGYLATQDARKNWNINHPDRLQMARRINKLNRAAKIRGNGGRHTQKQIKWLYVLQDGLCYWCGCKVDKYHVDHIVPVSKGGSDWLTNVCISCPKCNQLKSDLMPELWIKKIKSLSI